MRTFICRMDFVSASAAFTMEARVEGGVGLKIYKFDVPQHFPMLSGGNMFEIRPLYSISGRLDFFRTLLLFIYSNPFS